MYNALVSPVSRVIQCSILPAGDTDYVHEENSYILSLAQTPAAHYFLLRERPRPNGRAV